MSLTLVLQNTLLRMLDTKKSCMCMHVVNTYIPGCLLWLYLPAVSDPISLHLSLNDNHIVAMAYSNY